MLIMFVGLCTVFEIYKIIETLVSRKAPYSMFEACYHFFLIANFMCNIN